MGQTLTNGIYLPDEGEVRCYAGLASNWTTLDAVVGGYNAHVANENIHITSAERSKWNNGVTQAYVLRYANTSLTALGTVAFSALDNTDNIKIGDKVLDSEGKLFALTAVDTANSTATLSALLIDLSKDSDLSNYYTKTETDTLLSDKANDADAVHKSGAETIAGLKTFSDDTYFKSLNFTNEVASQSSSGSAILPLLATITYRDETPSATARFNLRITAAGEKSLYPHENNQYSLGLASRRLKEIYTHSLNVVSQINGINPGALSLPNLSAGVDISGYIANLSKGVNTYTPPANGWVVIRVRKTYLAHASLMIYQPGGLLSSCETTEFGISGTNLPVIANQNIEIYIIADSLASAKFYPCTGNV